MRLVSMCALASVTALPTHFPTERECRWCEEVRGALEQIADTADALRATIDHVARNYYTEAETYTYDTADALRAAVDHVASNYARVFYSDENGILTEDHAEAETYTYDVGSSEFYTYDYGWGSFREERTHDDTYTYDAEWEKTWPDEYPSLSKLSDDTFWNTSDVDEHLEALAQLEDAMWTTTDVPAFWDAWGDRVDLCLHATESPELRASALRLYGETLFEMPDRKGFYQTTYPRFVVPYLTDQDADMRHTAQGIVDTMRLDTEATVTYKAFMEEKTSR